METKTTTVGPIVRLIRSAAQRKGINAHRLAAMTGMSYSRSWELLKGDGHRKMANVERALEALAPEILAKIEKEASK